MSVNDDFWKSHVGPGWWPILDGLAAALSEAEVVQVKEKFGELRVYLKDYGTPAQRSAILDATMTSLVTCEECGQPGTLREELRWIRTLCDEHVKGKK